MVWETMYSSLLISQPERNSTPSISMNNPPARSALCQPPAGGSWVLISTLISSFWWTSCFTCLLALPCQLLPNSGPPYPSLQGLHVPLAPVYDTFDFQILFGPGPKLRVLSEPTVAHPVVTELWLYLDLMLPHPLLLPVFSHLVIHTGMCTKQNSNWGTDCLSRCQISRCSQKPSTFGCVAKFLSTQGFAHSSL